MWTISPASLRAASALAILALAAANPARANLIVNGDFSTAGFSSWTVTGNVVQFGNQAVFNSGDTTPNAVVSQSINTIAGQAYALTFQYGWGSYNFSGQSITASVLDGATVLTSALESPPFVDLYSSGGFQTFELDFIAASSTTVIEFVDYALNNTISSDGGVTNVSVDAVPVPEPTSLMLLAIGAGGTLLRRSRRKIVQAS